MTNIHNCIQCPIDRKLLIAKSSVALPQWFSCDDCFARYRKLYYNNFDLVEADFFDFGENRLRLCIKNNGKKYISVISGNESFSTSPKTELEIKTFPNINSIKSLQKQIDNLLLLK